MARTPAKRRLATVLFLDIVGSTRIAAEIGDQRWKAALSRFRGVVRDELKRHGGHEEDTTGDGFFATFAQPAQALAAAVSMIPRIQELGLDARFGLHFGECEVIEGQLGGIAVHIGARVMTFAGAAEVVMTNTVREMVVGAEMEVEDAGAHELKGVPGTWHLWRLQRIGGAPISPPLAPDAAAERLASRGVAASTRKPRAVLGAAVVIALATIVGIAGIFAGWWPRVAALAGLGPDPDRATLVRVDPATNALVGDVRDAYHASHYTNGLWAVNGALWQAVNDGFVGLVRRDIQSGAAAATIPLPSEPSAGTFGFGSMWIAGLTGPGSLERWDEVTGRKTASLTVDATIASVAAGSDAIWVLGDAGDLFTVDPVAATQTARYATGATHPGAVVALADRVWVCDCEVGHIIEFDPRTGTATRTLSFPQKGVLAGLTDDAGRTTLWLLDFDGNTVTPIDDSTGQAGQPIGVGENLHAATVAFGSLWIARGDKLIRVVGDGEDVTIRTPAGFSAGALAADPQTGALWVGDCGCPIN